ncbi:MAG: RecX family transcriptional regulator [Saprospiraceae bacterium]|nr:RecX family transcriptional regulator [Saprospiraceae bacterium]MBP6695147.1 RecX family transcriptional regulator [Saprospiraceae bacterium]
MENKTPKKWTKENVKLNIETYCVYQERCHEEVRSKLLNHGIYGELLEEIISDLIENNYLNEERFAIQFAGGKFRMKKWGKVKIKQALLIKKVSAYSVREALSRIGDEEYLQSIKYWIEKRGGIRGNEAYEEKMELIRFLQSKGFEMEWINMAME